jgi:hypothetical protein
MQWMVGSILFGGMIFSTSLTYAAIPEKEKTVQVVQAEDMTEVLGVVYDAATCTPLAGVRIVAHGSSKYATMTGEDGTYSF